MEQHSVIRICLASLNAVSFIAFANIFPHALRALLCLAQRVKKYLNCKNFKKKSSLTNKNSKYVCFLASNAAKSGGPKNVSLLLHDICAKPFRTSRL